MIIVNDGCANISGKLEEIGSDLTNLFDGLIKNSNDGIALILSALLSALIDGDDKVDKLLASSSDEISKISKFFHSLK